MLRNIGAVIAGLFIGMIVNMAFIVLNTSVLYPLPPGADMNDPAQVEAWIGSVPATAMLMIIVAHLGQSFVGGWVAARLATGNPMRPALIVGVLTLVGGVANMMMIAHPPWMMIELPLYLAVAWLAGRLELRRRAEA